MSRPLRIEYEGALYHITSRGDRREKIFYDDADRKLFLEILALTIKRHNWLLHSYCLMDNHYHLLVETPDSNLSLGMRMLNGVYTQKFNRLHKIVGHLFQGRFKSIVVEKESYLLELSRYIVLNPVRAKIVKTPEKWIWSSYNATIGLVNLPDFLTIDWLLSRFGDNLHEARKAYEEFVLKGIGSLDSPWKNLKGKTFLGGKAFSHRIKSYLEDKRPIKEIPSVERFASRPDLSDLFDHKVFKTKKERNNKIYDAHIKYGYTMKEIAQKLTIHYSTVSKIIKNMEELER
jgi:REP element-mobilizing transposase RayT